MIHECDILVVGGGPAGIAAATAAACSNQTVTLADDNLAPGGQIWRQGPNSVIPSSARQWLAKLNAAPVQRLQAFRVFDQSDDGVLNAEHNGHPVKLRYKKLILTTGARERFLPFPGWTLPNVMGAGALDAMVKGGLPVAGKRIVVAGTGPLLLAVGAHLAEAGAQIAAICEQATIGRLFSFSANLLREPSKLVQGFVYRTQLIQAKVHTGCWPVAADGEHELKSVTVSNGGRQWDIPCDYLACGFHLVPNVELPLLLGCELQQGFVVVDNLQQTSLENIFCAGEPTGIGGVDRSLLEGQIAGLAACGALEQARLLAYRHRPRKARFSRSLAQAFSLRPELKTLAQESTIVCRCEDVSWGALRNYRSWREGKLHTRCGMGPCQGRVCGAATEFLLDWNLESVRPPIFPVLLANFASTRKTNSASKEPE